jgi:hypothetical protein
VRGAGPLAVRRLVGTVLRACRSGSLPQPVLRADVTGAVLDTAVHTIVRVLAVEARGTRPLLQLDGLPTGVDPALRVLRSPGPPRPPARLLITARGRMRTAWLHGGPAVPGGELAAGGWVETGHPLVVHGFAGSPGRE